MKTAIILLITFRISFAKPIQDSTPFGSNNVDLSKTPNKQPSCTGEFDFDCGEGELRTRCISSLWMCDHVYDCTTGADEVMCSHLHQCPTGHFMCRNGDCILANRRCDGHHDCLDDSDERACFPRFPELMSNIPPNQQQHLSYDEGKNNPQSTRITGRHQAEPIKDQRDDGGLSALTVLFCCTLIIGVGLLLILWSLRRFPNTASRVDQALKDFTPRNVIPNRLLQQRSTLSRMNASPSNDQFFDNPMNTVQQPLMLNISTSSPAANMPPPRNSTQ